MNHERVPHFSGMVVVAKKADGKRFFGMVVVVARVTKWYGTRTDGQRFFGMVVVATYVTD